MFWKKLKKQPLPKTADDKTGIEEHLKSILPMEILNLLNIKKYCDLSVGVQQYFNTTVMDINTAGFTEYAGKRSTEQVFEYINRMHSRLIPLLSDNGGIIDSFFEGGLTAFYPEDPGKSLKAAVLACDCIRSMKGDDSLYDEVSIGISYGSVMAGLVGHEKRMTVLTFSESENFASFLRSLGGIYGAKIIVSHSCLERLGEAEKTFNYRYLGRVFLRSSNQVEKIFDVYDGDCVEVRNLKRKTKIIFEKGISLFEDNQLFQARLHFIEVLKMDYDDCAAREYLLRCDCELNGVGEKNRFLEIF